MKKIDQKVDDTINSFDNVQSVELSPFFYTRIEQAIEQKTNEEFVSLKFVSGVLISLLMVVLVNFWVCNAELNTKERYEKIAVDVLTASIDYEEY